jgi:putative Mg2+ transporter-C (MgtC) family protein
MTFTEFSIGLGSALGLGLLIGLERQFGQHPAGMRTNGLVAAGAAVYVLLGRTLMQGADAGKVAAQIVSGMGFLGGGVILREGLTVRGLNTAATLWCSAAVGALCGAEMAVQGCMTAAAILATNIVFEPVVRWIDRHAAQRLYVDRTFRLKVVCAMSEERRIRSMIIDLIAAQPDVTLHSLGIHSTDDQQRGIVVAEFEMHVRNEHVLQDMVATLNKDPDTLSTNLEKRS